MLSYEEKYLKYKRKYLNYKNYLKKNLNQQNGGNIGQNITSSENDLNHSIFNVNALSETPSRLQAFEYDKSSKNELLKPYVKTGGKKVIEQVSSEESPELNESESESGSESESDSSTVVEKKNNNHNQNHNKHEKKYENQNHNKHEKKYEKQDNKKHEKKYEKQEKHDKHKKDKSLSSSEDINSSDISESDSNSNSNMESDSSLSA